VKIRELTDVPSVREYLNRVGAQPRSLKAAVVKQVSGNYWKDLAIIKFTQAGDIDCSTLEHAPTDLERQMIKDALSSVTWPELKRMVRLIDPPQMVKDAAPEDVFEFRDKDGQIIMVQVKNQLKNGDRYYAPWTYWDDDQWRMCEPDGPLPLFNADKIGDNTTVFIHEGAKAARTMQSLIEAADKATRQQLTEHPWGLELSGAVHVGWIGGALSPYRTDWSVLKAAGVKRAYIVADNDSPGRSAVPAIAQHLRMPTFTVQFTDEFPGSFDLADPFPKKMFSNGAGERAYIGPSFRDCLHPATWATDVVPPAKEGGRPGHVLRDSFKGMWAYIEEADIFVCTEMPEIMRNEAILNKMLASFSHVTDTCRLIIKAYQGRSTRVCYRPDVAGLKVTFRGSSAINLHVPSNVRSVPGDPQPFLDFIDYLFVNEIERHEALRWIATLIACPGIRMHYGLLLISEKQGVGKTTLGASILAPLVGIQNVGFPGENDVTSAFNEWVAHKRLAIVSEIYSGSSWKAYHALKSVITDKDISVNQKYMRQYTIENWCHILASSNSMRALKMENDDRRWFYPEVTEVPWSRERFDELRKWLNSGGLGIIKSWAEAWGNYVNQSDRAPMTDRKREMIEGSRSEAQQEAAALAEALKNVGRPAGLLIKDVVGWARAHVQGRVFDTDYELRRAMVECGLFPWPKRIKVGGRLQYAVINPMLLDLAQRADDPMDCIRDKLMKCTEIMDGEM
jgi:hypothetical protein